MGRARCVPYPPPHKWPDYVDLAETESLQELGRPRELRTLFLYGSGVLVPPASEHGEKAEDNVAERTLSFFEDVDLCGSGDVKRCKLLVLGNGDAGKTSLSLALVPGQDPQMAKKLGSTHGVQFWDWRLSALIGETYDEVHLQLWDFGGQEIYHQTHRLFMSKGAVFVVLWDPDQDDLSIRRRRSEGYQDEWRPLQYWLDLIHEACPWKPRGSPSCARGTRSACWGARRALEVSKCLGRRTARSPRASTSTPWHGDGELRDLLKGWLTKSVGKVVRTQGTAVPAYWEIAQDLVASWLPQAGLEAAVRSGACRVQRA